MQRRKIPHINTLFSPDSGAERKSMPMNGQDYFEKALEIRSKAQKEFSTEELDCLIKANELQNFQAAREIQYYYLGQLSKPFDEKLIEKITNHAEQTAQVHKTPGHLLAAASYIKLGEKSAHLHAQMRASAYFNAFRHLCLARELEGISKKAISHAYFDETISTAFQKGYAGPFKIPFESFDQIIRVFLTETKLNTTFANKIEADAKLTAAAIKQQQSLHPSTVASFVKA
jgi:hypothetical protein